MLSGESVPSHVFRDDVMFVDLQFIISLHLKKYLGAFTISFNITTFRSNIAGNKRLAYTGFFDVTVTNPYNNSPDIIKYRAEGVVLPEKSVDSTKLEYYGLPYKIASRAAVPNHTLMSLLCSTDLSERKFFAEWLDKIGGNHRTVNGSGTGMFDVEYYNSYKGQFVIDQYNEYGAKIYTVKYLDAYPLEIGPIQQSWANQDVMRFTLTIAYRYYQDQNLPTLLDNPIAPSPIPIRPVPIPPDRPTPLDVTVPFPLPRPTSA
jgi:hypothetical protein